MEGYSRPLIEQVHDVPHRKVDYDKESISLSYLSCLSNKFVEQYQFGKTNKQLTDDDINQMIQYFLKPFNGTKIMLDVIFCDKDNIRVRYNDKHGHQLRAFYEITDTVPSDSGVFDIDGVLRIFGHDYDKKSGDHHKMVHKADGKCEWDSKYKHWRFQYGDKVGIVLKRPAMGFEMFKIY